MKNNFKIFLSCLVVFLVIVLLTRWIIYQTFNNINKSHINDEVPKKDVFEEYLIRDIKDYFTEKYNPKINIKYKLLRDYPTQSGVSFPKYYLWVTVSSDSWKIIDQGALRVSAQEKKYFVITDYFSLEQIQSDPVKLKKIFPSLVIEKILKEYANQSS